MRGKVISLRTELMVPGSAPVDADPPCPQTLEEFNTKYLKVYHSLLAHDGLEERKELPVDDIDP